MNIVKKIALSLAFSALAASSAFAYNAAPLPASTYITDNGLDWTWASPWGTVNEGIKVAAPSAHEGWRYATVAELEYLFANLVDEFVNGGSPIQSVAYWELDGTNWVDISDLESGAIMSGNNYFNGICPGNVCEVFYVRDANAVPAPMTLALLGAGFLALGFSRRTKKAA
ncbi:MAG TPA: PEP-CTERM sorting domain-containing protein [Rhodocyclaceae bacterium]|nr:PEP-CTERM sorting domain-containing protein [Rhodocyclaceae bacterium]